MDANQLRTSFTDYFANLGHEVVASASLIPHDPSVLFTIAGMVPFKPYFLGDETPPWKRATSVQKCFRTLDIDIVGSTSRHETFFEMLGNFSFGDYFKETAIPSAWKFVTEVLGMDPSRLWVTVHESDDEALGIWIDSVGVDPGRIQKMDEDNFWSMGDTGPCGPCSEIYFDNGKGDEGGPAHGSSDRYIEIWNLVFMQFNRGKDGTLADLPKKSIDTGAGLDRILAVTQSVESVFATDVLLPMLEKAESLTSTRYGKTEQSDVALRVMADHGRAMTMLVADGVLPSNEGRGYVLRRVVRRAVLAGRRLGAEEPFSTALAQTTSLVMGDAYPKLRSELDLISAILEREEAGFDRTLRAGLNLLEEAFSNLDAKGISAGGEDKKTLSGETAFRLHDTHGFPIELTEELAKEACIEVDRGRYEILMQEQRVRARQASSVPKAADEHAYRELLESLGPTNFVGRDASLYSTSSRVLGVLVGHERNVAEIFLDRTPFYSESGGQVGDCGAIVTETGRAEVFDSVFVLPGLTAHRARIHGEIFVGQDALAAIEGDRREAIRRNHTGTHLLHGALREVLGSHVRQQGSYVAPDRLRFDFHHHASLNRAELSEILYLANGDVIRDDHVETTETSRSNADAMGAVAFFGDKYGDLVRVVRAGPHSLEFCGGTHVDSLGQIGPVAILSEASIGANTRRIEAVTGTGAIARSLEHEALLEDVAALLKVEPDGVLDALGRLVDRGRALDKELGQMKFHALEKDAAELAQKAESGVVIARLDGRSPSDLRATALAITRDKDIVSVVLVGTPDANKVAIVVASNGELDSGAFAKELASIVGGGGGGSKEIAVAGGKEPSRIGEVMDKAKSAIG